MKRVIFINDPFDHSQREVVETDDVYATLATRWEKLPHTVGLFHGIISPDTNVTPHDEEGIERLCALDGDIYAVQFPGDYFTAAVLIISLIFSVVAYMNTPSVPTADVSLSRPPSSANNDLSERVNKPRVNGRIPDIYGTEISVPDIVAAPYTIYNDHEAYEYSYLCIGRGEFEIANSEDVKDDATPLEAVDGSSAAFYGPDTSPNNGEPFYTIGAPINEPVLSVAKTSAVNGQTLNAPNETEFNNFVRYLYPNTILAAPGAGIDFTELFEAGDEIQLSSLLFGPGSGNQNVFAAETTSGGITVNAAGGCNGISFYEIISEGVGLINGATQTIQISMSTQSIGGEDINLSGIYYVATDDAAGTSTLLDVDLVSDGWALLPGGDTLISGVTVSLVGRYGNFSLSGNYVIDTVVAETMTLTEPVRVNPNWTLTYYGGSSLPDPATGGGTSAAATIALDGADVAPTWIGPYDVYLPQMDGFIINLVAERGMWRDDGTAQSGTSVDIQLEVTLLSENGQATSAARYTTVTVVGSALSQSKRALTYRPSYAISGASGVRVRARRLTERDTGYTGQVVDAVQWAEFYATSSATPAHFGNVTTVHSVTRATKGALSLKQRKLNAKVTRKIPIIEGGGELSETNVATRDVASIIAAITLDPKLGNRTLAEIDLLNLRETIDNVAEYFGRNSTTRFSYTFDNDNLSFQDMITSVANAAFCTAYREGSVIKLHFERLTDESSLIFCHRNKLPRTEKRTTTFGKNRNYDGVEYTWKDPKDSAAVTLYFPPDRSAVNPNKIDSIGIRSLYQATLHGWRVYNRQRYQRVRVEFKATHEAELLLRNQRVLVSNNVKPHAQDGEVRGKNGLVLITSQPVTFDPAIEEYFVFLQLDDGTVQSIACTEGPDRYSLVLAEEPSRELSLNPSNFAIATYIVVPAQLENTLAFLVDSRTYDGPFTSNVTCVNYDPRYYTNDQDFNYRRLIYTDHNTPYSDATTEQKENGGFFADQFSGVIPPTTDAPYVFDDETED